MKVSIITATFNSEKTLNICMTSVLEQTYSNIEYILVDGQSSDHTVKLIQEFALQHENIQYISEHDDGIYDALNKGIKKATGDVIGFVHSDDFLANPNIVEDIVCCFKRYNVDGVYGNLHYVSSTNINKVLRNWESRPFSKKLLKLGWMPAHPTLFLKASVYKNKGVFNKTFRIAADYDFILRIFTDDDYSFYFLPKVITKMRVGGKSNNNLKNIIKKTREDLNAAKNNGLSLPYKVIFSKNISKLPQWFKI